MCRHMEDCIDIPSVESFGSSDPCLTFIFHFGTSLERGDLDFEAALAVESRGRQLDMTSSMSRPRNPSGSVGRRFPNEAKRCRV
jgi:hypothetical protein